ncbi:MAG: response regulator [Candidatus Rifleibacteriota bacterium]
MEKTDNKIRLLLADDHNIVRDGLKAVLEQNDDMKVVGVASDGRNAVKKTSKLAPDVVVMDISMPDLNGVDATRQIMESLADVKVVCLSVHRKTHFVNAMLEAGALGYLLKKSAGDELVDAVRTVMKDEVYLSTPVATDVIKHNRGDENHVSTTKNFLDLTAREREILQLIAEGVPASEIARQLGLSSKTVFAHRQKMMEKLGLDSTVAIVKYALREGIVDL